MSEVKFEKITQVRLPWDRRDPDPKKNYGIHSTDLWFILKGPKGAVQYAVTLPVFLPHVQRELERKEGTAFMTREIRGFDVGYHSPRPMYEDQKQMDCVHLEGGKCYYDGSSLRADSWTEIIFSTSGKHPEEVLWKLLEDEYYERFGNEQ
jgi:hypothetical protein